MRLCSVLLAVAAALAACQTTTVKTSGSATFEGGYVGGSAAAGSRAFGHDGR